VSIFEKFAVGGWVTLVITTGLILLCLKVKRHYRKVGDYLKRLDDVLLDIPPVEGWIQTKVVPNANTAVLMVKEYSGLGIHSFLSIQRLFPNYFKNVIFISVVNIDASTLKGQNELDEMIAEQQKHLEKYVNFATQMGYAADYRLAAGTDVIEEMEKLSALVAREFPRTIFFAGKLVFERERWYQRILHNETAYAIQRRLQFAALNCMVLPVRVFATNKA
jgi:hypothetical protein